MINLRLSGLSSNMNIFNDRTKPYNEALARSDFDDVKGYIDSKFVRKTKKKKLKYKNITYFKFQSPIVTQ